MDDNKGMVDIHNYANLGNVGMMTFHCAGDPEAALRCCGREIESIGDKEGLKVDKFIVDNGDVIYILSWYKEK
jgi:hypothetical protein